MKNCLFIAEASDHTFYFCPRGLGKYRNRFGLFDFTWEPTSDQADVNISTDGALIDFFGDRKLQIDAACREAYLAYELNLKVARMIVQ